MCRELFDSNDVFRTEMLLCSELCRHLIPEPLTDVIYRHRPSQPFIETRYTGIAILAVELSLTRVLAARGIHPDMVVGYSLGEVVAAVVGGALAPSDAFAILGEQSRLLADRCQKGSLIAIFAEQTIREVLADEFAGCPVIAFNSPKHFTAGGRSNAVGRLHRALRAREILSEILPVEYAYHTADMDDLRPDFDDCLAKVQLRPPQLPIFSCVNPAAQPPGHTGHFWNVVRSPVLFQQVVHDFESRGSFSYVDLGPRGTLAALVKQNLSPHSASRAFAAINPFGAPGRSLDQVQTALAP
jgi:acyl transferase domain-containing protein